MMEILTPIQDFLFPSGIFGSTYFFALGVIMLFAMLLWAMRVPVWVVFIMISPFLLIGSGSLISASIPGWIKGLVVMGIFALFGVGLVIFSSGNK